MTKVEIISVVTDDHKLAESLGAMKLDNNGGKAGSSSEEEGRGSQDNDKSKQKKKKGGKVSDEPAIPADVPTATTVVQADESVAKSQEPLPKRNGKKNSDKKDIVPVAPDAAKPSAAEPAKNEVKKAPASASPPPGIPVPPAKATGNEGK